MQRIPSNELDYPGDGLYYYKDKPFTGVAVAFSDGSKLEAEQEYRDGMHWGVAREWFRDGSLYLDAQFARGLLHGIRREWYPDGRQASQEVFEYGTRLMGKKWDENGNLVEDFAIKENDPAMERLRKLKDVFREMGDDC
jgi:antitoxin component YwqK of YwqJK toxin-antitoxin module